MKKTKIEKGITLIALIITIVVLMILAAVAINSITNDGIIGKAESVKNTYTEAQNEEQKMLDYYQLVLEGTAWTQNGTTVSRNGRTLNVGEKVTLKVGTADATEYSVDGYDGDWVVLGAEYGKLLLVSATNVVASVPLGGAYGGNINGTECVGGYYNGAAALDTICAAYLNTTYADSARSIKVEDINRVTGFKPENNTYYGETYTFTAENTADAGGFMHVDGREIGKNGVESITETNTEYNYSGLKYIPDTKDPAHAALFANTTVGFGYWLASPSVELYINPDNMSWADFALRSVGEHSVGDVASSGYVDLCYLFDSGDGGYAFAVTELGARAVVSIKPEVEVAKAS